LFETPIAALNIKIQNFCSQLCFNADHINLLKKKEKKVLAPTNEIFNCYKDTFERLQPSPNKRPN